MVLKLIIVQIVGAFGLTGVNLKKSKKERIHFTRSKAIKTIWMMTILVTRIKSITMVENKSTKGAKVF